MKVVVSSLVVLASASPIAGCSSDDGGPQELDRIDGPAQVDPEFREQNESDSRSDTGG